MKNHTEIAVKILAFINRVSAVKLTLVLFFGVIFAITFKPTVLQITFDYLAKL